MSPNSTSCASSLRSATRAIARWSRGRIGHPLRRGRGLGCGGRRGSRCRRGGSRQHDRLLVGLLHQLVELVPGRPSLLQDVIKGRRTEVDFLNGYAVKKGKELGVHTPMNEAIVDLMKKLENGEVSPDPSMLEQLKVYLLP